MSWITLFKRYSKKVQTWEKKCFKELCNHVERVDPTGKVLRRLRTLRRRKCQVEGPNALWLVFFHPSFHYRVYFQIRFLSTKRFKKSLYP